MSGSIDVSLIKESKSVEWEIPEFFENADDIELYKSPIPFSQKDCTLIVYPRGAYGATPEFVIVVLFLLQPDPDILINLRIDAEGCEEAVKTKTQEGDNEEGHYKMWTWLYDNETLQMLLDDDVLRGRLTISCKEENTNSSSTAAAACQTTFLSNTVHFRRDFQDLFLSGNKSDATIEVQGRLFKVHKLILEASSPVFYAMFDNDNSKNKDIVKIDDCDPDIFHKFLKCLYSGKLENTVSPNSLIGLYKVADQYRVTDLKEKCSEVIVKELSEDTVFEALAVADMSKDTELKTEVEKFLIKNIKMILRMKAWKEMQSKNPSFVAEILAKVFDD